MCPSHQTTYHCFITISPKLETSSFQSNAWERLCAFHTSLLLRIITIRLFYKFSQKPKLCSDKEIFSFYPGLHCSNSWFWVMHIDAYNNITVPLWTLHPEGNQIFFARYCLKKVFHFFPLSWGRTWCNFSVDCSFCNYGTTNKKGLKRPFGKKERKITRQLLNSA